MTEQELRHLMHQATSKITASESLRGRLGTGQPHGTGARRWWVAVAAAAAMLIAVPLLRPSAATPSPRVSPAASTEVRQSSARTDNMTRTTQATSTDHIATAAIGEAMPPNAIVKGRLLLFAGEVAKPRSITGDISVHGLDHSTAPIVATAKAGSDGHFEIKVPAGTYILMGTSPAFGAGRFSCQAQTAIAVAAGHTVNGVEVRCIGK